MNHFIKAERTDEMTYRALLQEARDGNLIKIRNGVYGTIDSLTGGMIDIEKSFLEALFVSIPHGTFIT